MKKLNNSYLLMRHEETVGIRRQIVSSDLRKYPLTPRGRRAARRAARRLCRDFNIDVIYASPVRRTFETACIVSQQCGAPVTTKPALREIGFGKFENGPLADYHAAFAKPGDRFYHSVGGTEPLYKVRERVVKCFKKIDNKHRGQTILIVSHGDPLRLLQGWLMDINVGATRRLASPQIFQLGEVRQIVSRVSPFRFKRLY